MGKPTLRDVAKQAGCSISTASRVLKGGKAAQRFSPQTQRIIRETASRIGYKRNTLAFRLRVGKSMTIAMLESNIASPWFANMTALIEQGLYEHGYMLLLCNSMEDPAKEMRYLELLAGGSIDGMILVPLLKERDALYKLIREDLPLVLLDRPIEGVNACVSSELEQPAEKLCDQLFEAGVRKLALIQGPDHVLTHCRRAEVVASRFPLIDRHTGPATRETGFDAMRKWAGRELPAIICTNVSLALGACAAMSSWQHPPIIGCFDEIPTLDLLRVPIACATQDIPELAKSCVNMLLSQIRFPNTPVSPITLPATIVSNEPFKSLLKAHLATGTG